MNFPYEVPNSIGEYPPLSDYIGIKICFFFNFLFVPMIGQLWLMSIPVP